MIATQENTKTIRATGFAAQNKTAKLEKWEFERNAPEANDVQIEVMFCGVCHSDIHQARDEWHNTVWPSVPGHEVVGKVSQIGSAVTKFKVGDIVGVGCMINSCGHCENCKSGDQQYCTNGVIQTYNGPSIPDGSNTFGGYSNNLIANEHFVMRIPEKIAPEKAAPLLCAGVTTFSPMKHWNIGKGHKVGIAGIGGLGHVAIQIAKARGAEVTALTKSPDKVNDAKRFGAANVILASDEKAMEAQAGTLDFIISTIPTGHDLTPYMKLLKTNGTLIVLGALEQLNPPPNMMPLAAQRKSIGASLIGNIAETQEILDFCAEHSITPEIKIINIAQINEVFEEIIACKARYRYVIDSTSIPK
jgi:uncharacterized zinc-type alcohol dehydrogenase-like protein